MVRLQSNAAPTTAISRITTRNHPLVLWDVPVGYSSRASATILTGCQIPPRAAVFIALTVIWFG